MLAKFSILCWKNWIIIKRHPLAALLEFLLPILFTIAAIFMINQQSKTIVKEPNAFNIYTCNQSHINISELWYAPDNEFNRKLMDDVSERFSMNFKVMKDEEELNDKLIRNRTAAVAIVAFDATALNQPKHLKYTIRMPEGTFDDTRWKTDELYYHGFLGDPRPNSYSPSDMIYYFSCFLKLQNEIDQAFIKALNNGREAEKLKLIKTFPIAERIDGFFKFAVEYFPFVLALSMTYSFFKLIKDIKIEVMSRHKKSMEVMGLSVGWCWSSWFIRSFAPHLISLTFIVIITSITIFNSSNSFIIWIFFMSYITSLITFCFLVSVVFETCRARIIGMVVFIATFAPYIIFHKYFFKFSYGLKVLFCMLINTNMGQGIKMILMAEVHDGGVGFGNIFKRSVDMKFTFAELLLWMNIGSVLQMLVTILIEKIKFEELDTKNVIKLGFINAFQKPFRTIMKSHNINAQENLRDEEMAPLCNFEIEIKDLTKKFKNEFAVKNLSLNLKKNQITTLLGPSGAGKSSVVSMLTGLYQPTSGTVIIHGYDTSTQIDEARKSMGVCLQQNALFEELTVQENLEFFCKLKGMTDIKNIKMDVEKYAKSLELSDQLDSQCKSLTHIQKRKVSIAIAMCGGSKFVILDEPMAGMDQTTFKQLWDLLNAEKADRSILVTTNNLDEAEIFGDQIAIMSNGRLFTVDSSLNLKKKLGFGYRLTCVVLNKFKSESVINLVNTVAMDETNRRTIENPILVSALESESITEVAFVISKDLLPDFDKIFESLEDKLVKLDILSYQFSYVSIEDIIMRQAYEDHKKFRNDTESNKLKQDSNAVTINMQEKFHKTSIFQQFYAMFLKKWYILRQSWMMFAVLGIISLFVIFLVPILFYVNPNKSTNLQISLDSYGHTETFVELDKMSNISMKYISLFSGKDKIISPTTNISTDILKKYRQTQARINQVNLMAVEFKNNLITAWFNTQLYHTMPLTVNTVNRAVLKSIAGDDYDITVTNHPYSFSKTYEGNKSMLSFTVLFLMIIWPMIYIGNYIKERESRFMFLQFICGTNRLVYCFTNLIFDYILFILICFLLFGCLVCLNYDMNQWLKELTILMIVGSSYGFSWICFIYVFSYLFRKSSTGEAMLLFLSVVLAIMSAIENVLQYTFFKFGPHWIGMLFGPFNLVKMTQIVTLATRRFEYSVLNESIVMNVVSGCFYFLIAVLREFNFFVYVYNMFRKPAQASSSKGQQLFEIVPNEDQSADIISDEDIKESAAAFNKLLKTHKNITAVNQKSINLDQTAAGETTIFQMMTGDELITTGEIWIKKKSQKTQFDNFLPEMTGREVLKIIGLICGFKMDEIAKMIEDKASEFKPQGQLNNMVKTFTCEDKKKLITVLAQLGNPDLIFLDECSTATDCKRLLEIKQMDESKALIARKDIIVDNQFQCLGPVQNLKIKFSKGFILTIKTGFTEDLKIKNLREIVTKKFLYVKLKWMFSDTLIFHLTNCDFEFNYSEIYRLLSEIKKKTEVQDYTLSQMSPENAFLKYSKQVLPFTQEEATKIAQEEQKWKEEEIAERKQKIEEKLEKIFIKKKLRKMAREIAHLRLQKQKELTQREMEHLIRMERKKLELEREIQEKMSMRNESGFKRWLYSKIKNIARTAIGLNTPVEGTRIRISKNIIIGIRPHDIEESSHSNDEDLSDDESDDGLDDLLRQFNSLKLLEATSSS